MIKLVCEAGQYLGMELVIDDELVMGRDPSRCQLIFDRPGISSKHCNLIKLNGKLYIEDLGSTNGTYTSDGMRMQPNVRLELKNGDRFYLSDQNNLFRVVIDDTVDNGIPISKRNEQVSDERIVNKMEEKQLKQKSGFNVVAFFFPIIWSYARKLWTTAIIGTVVTVIFLYCIIGSEQTCAYYYNLADEYSSKADDIANEWNDSSYLERIEYTLEGSGFDARQQQYDDALTSYNEYHDKAIVSGDSAVSGRIILIIFHIVFGIFMGIKGNEMLLVKQRRMVRGLWNDKVNR